MKPTSNKLTILVVPINNAVGHANACAGVTRPLLARGHRVLFCLEPSFRGRFQEQGFEEILFDNLEEDVGKNSKPGQAMAQILTDSGVFQKLHPSEKIMRSMGEIKKPEYIEMVMRTNEQLKGIIERTQPDLFVVDNVHLMPAIHYSGKPWIKVNSIMPLWGQNHQDLPPACMGLPYNDKSEYEKYRNVLNQAMDGLSLFNDHIERAGYPRYANDEIMPATQSLDVYAYPDELNYPEIRASSWFNLEMFNHHHWESSKTLDALVPKQFYEDTLDGRFSGKYVYLSMGSMGSVDVNLMRRLVQVLGATPHKYIVSKGLRHSEWQLTRNMWGDQFLPQVALLPHVDLVITHGGNNTTTEAFSHGKPMIVFPLFGDQPDNAQRIHETGYGVRLEPYDFEDDQLVEAVDNLLNDDLLKRKLVQVGERLRNVDHSERLADKIEAMFA